MENFKNALITLGTQVGGKILLALLTLVVGLILIKVAKKIIAKVQAKSKLDKTAQSVIKNIIIALLYGVLLLIIIEILGIPMTSVVAVLASCGLAVGLALQGALSNFAGGLMILIFKPFKVDEYISATGVEGTVQDISVFYTHLLTVDNKHITIPNGDLMNHNVINFSREPKRRVDIDFRVTNDINQDLVREVLAKAVSETAGVLNDPAPFARLTGVADDTFIFTIRAWCETAQYWDVYFAAIENCTKALGANGIDDPEDKIVVRMAKEN